MVQLVAHDHQLDWHSSGSRLVEETGEPPLNMTMILRGNEKNLMIVIGAAECLDCLKLFR